MVSFYNPNESAHHSNSVQWASEGALACSCHSVHWANESAFLKSVYYFISTILYTQKSTNKKQLGRSIGDIIRDSALWHQCPMCIESALTLVCNVSEPIHQCAMRVHLLQCEMRVHLLQSAMRVHLHPWAIRVPLHPCAMRVHLHQCAMRVHLLQCAM